MHTAMVIAGGLALLAAFVIVGSIVAGWGAAPRAALAFVPVWLVAAIGNMAVGVMQAGYTVAQELPIFIVVFAVPAAVAAIAFRLLARSEKEQP